MEAKFSGRQGEDQFNFSMNTIPDPFGGMLHGGMVEKSRESYWSVDQSRYCNFVGLEGKVCACVRRSGPAEAIDVRVPYAWDFWRVQYEGLHEICFE